MVSEPIKDMKKIGSLLKYLKGQNERDWLLAKFQLNNGLRIGDVVKVQVNQFYKNGKFLDYLFIIEEKTNKAKKIKLNDELRKALKAYIQNNKLQEEDYIFYSRKGSSHITTTQAYRILKSAAVTMSIENFSTHSLRKSWGYWTYKISSYNIGLIMDMFNHSSQAITLRYIGITQEQKDELYSICQF